jgi:hypothetical protein
MCSLHQMNEALLTVIVHIQRVAYFIICTG